MTLRKAAMTIWKKTVLKKKKASTNSSLSVKSLGFQLVMNLQPCATAFCIAKTSTLNICYISSLSVLSMLCRGSNLLYNLTIVMLTATFCVLHPQEELANDSPSDSRAANFTLRNREALSSAKFAVPLSCEVLPFWYKLSHFL